MWQIFSIKNGIYDKEQARNYNLNEDCPVFAGMQDYFERYAGASLDAGT